MLEDVSVPDVPLARLEDDDDDDDLLDRASPSNVLDVNRNCRLEEIVRDAESEEARKDAEGRLSDDLSGSLEDLVGNLDQKICHCLKDLDANTQPIAPVQVRTMEQLMSESQIWLTLTGEFGNLPPLDFSNMRVRQLLENALRTAGSGGRGSGKTSSVSEDESARTLTSAEMDEDDWRQRMDLHNLAGHAELAAALGGTVNGFEPPQSADQVIEEIDRIFQSVELSHSCTTDGGATMESVDSLYSSWRSPLSESSVLPGGSSIGLQQQQQHDDKAALRQAALLATSHDMSIPEDLASLSFSKLVALHAEMEQVIRIYNESLVEELALRDELEFEKELKNSFISMLISIQNRRRQFIAERKKRSGSSGGSASKPDLSKLPQYVTAVIPYHEQQTEMPNSTMQSLIKILRAINDDNPAVPTMLTEYILTVICPSTPKQSTLDELCKPE